MTDEIPDEPLLRSMIEEATVQKFFKLEMTHEVQCLINGCHHKSYNVEKASAIQLDLNDHDQKVHYLDKMLEKYFDGEEVSDENNRFDCPLCKIKVPYRKAAKLTKAPAVAIIRLKRST